MLNINDSESKISEIKTQYWLLNSLIDNALKEINELGGGDFLINGIIEQRSRFEDACRMAGLNLENKNSESL